MTVVFETVAKLPERDGAVSIYDEGVHATAGRVADLLPKLKDGTYKELVIRMDER
jgi:hypothetical protein